VDECKPLVPDFNLIGAVMFHFHRDMLTWQGS